LVATGIWDWARRENFHSESLRFYEYL
jgi:hypothetical protein